MKNVKLFLAALFAVAIAAPAFAQSQDPHANEKWNDGKAAVSAAIERAAVKAKSERQASECPKCHQAYTIDEKYHGVKHECAAKAKKDAKKAPACVRCGEEVRPGQHCEAAGYVALCTDTEEAPRAQTVSEDDASCPKCGQAYSIDERYHAIEHKCDAKVKKEAKKTPVCTQCGEKIISAGQHCEAAGYVALCTDAPTKKTEKVSSEDDANCPKCGKAYSIDERYHGAEHQCKDVK